MAIWTFAQLTLHEASRSRFLPITVGLAAAYIAMIAWGCHLILDRSPSVASAQLTAAGLEVLAFYMVSFVIALVAVFVSGASTHHDGETGLLQAMVTRPVRRFDLLAGRWVGSALLVTAYALFLTGGMIGAVGISVGYYPSHPFMAAGFLILEGLVILSLRLLFGTFLGNMASGILPLMLYGLGWMGGIVEAAGRALDIGALATAGIITSLLIPTDTLWRGISYSLTPQTAADIARTVGRNNPFLSLTPVATPMVIWAGAYVVGIFLLGAWFFSRRDV